jgi:pimeloyl-ACP methyl ester carboxylesterase
VLADLQLAAAKLHWAGLPRVGTTAFELVSEQLQALSEQHPKVFSCGKRVVVHLIGHSLGGYIAEAATVMCHEAFRSGAGSPELSSSGLSSIAYRCTTFDSPGLPRELQQLALRLQPEPEYWHSTMQHYLGAPNPVNTLHGRLGSTTHVIIEPELASIRQIQAAWRSATTVSLRKGALWLFGGALASVVGGPAAASRLARAGRSVLMRLGVPMAGMVLDMLGATSDSNSSITENMKRLACVLGREVLRQHSVDSMAPGVRSSSSLEAEPSCRQDMACWPELSNSCWAVTELLQAVSRWLLPLPGTGWELRGPGGSEKLQTGYGMVRRCARIPGYQPRQGQGGNHQVEVSYSDNFALQQWMKPPRLLTGALKCSIYFSV